MFFSLCFFLFQKVSSLIIDIRNPSEIYQNQGMMIKDSLYFPQLHNIQKNIILDILNYIPKNFRFREPKNIINY